MSAFLSFSQQMRPKIRTMFPDLKNTDISSVLAQKWHSANEDEKRPHIERELRDREKYHDDMAKWRQEEEQRKVLASSMDATSETTSSLRSASEDRYSAFQNQSSPSQKGLNSSNSSGSKGRGQIDFMDISAAAAANAHQPSFWSHSTAEDDDNYIKTDSNYNSDFNDDAQDDYKSQILGVFPSGSGGDTNMTHNRARNRITNSSSSRSHDSKNSSRQRHNETDSKGNDEVESEEGANTRRQTALQKEQRKEELAMERMNQLLSDAVAVDDNVGDDAVNEFWDNAFSHFDGGSPMPMDYLSPLITGTTGSPEAETEGDKMEVDRKAGRMNTKPAISSAAGDLSSSSSHPKAKRGSQSNSSYGNSNSSSSGRYARKKTTDATSSSSAISSSQTASSSAVASAVTKQHAAQYLLQHQIQQEERQRQQDEAFAAAAAGRYYALPRRNTNSIRSTSHENNSSINSTNSDSKRSSRQQNQQSQPQPPTSFPMSMGFFHGLSNQHYNGTPSAASSSASAVLPNISRDSSHLTNASGNNAAMEFYLAYSMLQQAQHAMLQQQMRGGISPTATSGGGADTGNSRKRSHQNSEKSDMQSHNDTSSSSSRFDSRSSSGKDSSMPPPSKHMSSSSASVNSANSATGLHPTAMQSHSELSSLGPSLNPIVIPPYALSLYYARLQQQLQMQQQQHTQQNQANYDAYQQQVQQQVQQQQLFQQPPQQQRREQHEQATSKRHNSEQHQSARRTDDGHSGRRTSTRTTSRTSAASTGGSVADNAGVCGRGTRRSTRSTRSSRDSSHDTSSTTTSVSASASNRDAPAVTAATVPPEIWQQRAQIAAMAIRGMRQGVSPDATTLGTTSATAAPALTADSIVSSSNGVVEPRTISRADGDAVVVVAGHEVTGDARDDADVDIRDTGQGRGRRSGSVSRGRSDVDREDDADEDEGSHSSGSNHSKAVAEEYRRQLQHVHEQMQLQQQLQQQNLQEQLQRTLQEQQREEQMMLSRHVNGKDMVEERGDDVAVEDEGEEVSDLEEENSPCTPPRRSTQSPESNTQMSVSSTSTSTSSSSLTSPTLHSSKQKHKKKNIKTTREEEELRDIHRHLPRPPSNASADSDAIHRVYTNGPPVVKTKPKTKKTKEHRLQAAAGDDDYDQLVDVEKEEETARQLQRGSVFVQADHVARRKREHRALAQDILQDPHLFDHSLSSSSSPHMKEADETTNDVTLVARQHQTSSDDINDADVPSDTVGSGKPGDTITTDPTASTSSDPPFLRSPSVSKSKSMTTTATTTSASPMDTTPSTSTSTTTSTQLMRDAVQILRMVAAAGFDPHAQWVEPHTSYNTRNEATVCAPQDTEREADGDAQQEANR